MEVPNAQSYSAGELVELANVLSDLITYKTRAEAFAKIAAEAWDHFGGSEYIGDMERADEIRKTFERFGMEVSEVAFPEAADARRAHERAVNEARPTPTHIALWDGNPFEGGHEITGTGYRRFLASETPLDIRIGHDWVLPRWIVLFDKDGQIIETEDLQHVISPQQIIQGSSPLWLTLQINPRIVSA